MSDSILQEQAYHHDRNYRSLVIWTFNSVTKERISVTKITCNPGLERKERYYELKRVLKSKGIPVPAYRDLPVH